MLQPDNVHFCNTIDETEYGKINNLLYLGTKEILSITKQFK